MHGEADVPLYIEVYNTTNFKCKLNDLHYSVNVFSPWCSVRCSFKVRIVVAI